MTHSSPRELVMVPIVDPGVQRVTFFPPFLRMKNRQL